MNDNCIYFHLKKLQLGPIDAAFQKLQYALKNIARADFFFLFSEHWHATRENFTIFIVLGFQLMCQLRIVASFES